MPNLFENYRLTEAAYLASLQNFLFIVSIPVDPYTTQLEFVPSAKPKNAEPPEVILSFNVSVLPPTNVTCQLKGDSVTVSSVSREVLSKEYNTSPGDESPSPATNVTVTMKTREAGNYWCNISVFKTSDSGYKYLLTAPIHIAGWIQLYTCILILTNALMLAANLFTSHRHANWTFLNKDWVQHSAALLECPSQQHTTRSRLRSVLCSVWQ